MKEIRACKTIPEIDEILNKHDALMKELHLTGRTEFDKQTKDCAQNQKRKLEKERNNY